MGKKKYVIREPHYIDGVYHDASAQDPKPIDIDDKWEPEKSKKLVPYKGGPLEGEKLGKHFDDAAKTHIQSSAQVHSEPDPNALPLGPDAPAGAQIQAFPPSTEEKSNDKPFLKDKDAKGGKRSSDKDPF